MKKLSSLILAVLLAVLLAVSLAACNTPATVDPSPIPSPSASPTATPSTSPTPSPTPTPQQSPTAPIPAVLPDIPRDFPDEPFTLDEIGTQYYGSPQYEFVPSDEYGAVVPYVGGLRSVYDGDRVLIGFVTTDGRVVCEPIFSSCNALSDGDISVYVAERPQYVGGKNTIEYWLISSSGASATKYEKIYSITNNYSPTGYLTVQLGYKWGVIKYSGDMVLPMISDYAVDMYLSESDNVFLITEIGKEWKDRAIDIAGYGEEFYDEDYTLDPIYVNIRVPETIAKFFIDVSGSRLTESEYIVYSDADWRMREAYKYDNGVLRDYSYKYAIPSGYKPIPITGVSHYIGVYSNDYLDIDPPFVIFCSSEYHYSSEPSPYFETRLPDGTVLVRRSQLYLNDD
ncbi:MAG: hypothetical protein LBN02_05300 [Oscillospiraceae bacterium]|jgi:hypothetical protein|nr:hypothetical protein [Oscillospiraceae bacterium]